MAAEHPDKELDLYAIEPHLSQMAGFHEGGVVCIERAGRPWRLAIIRELDEHRVVTQNGFEYERTTGRRLPLDTPSKDVLRALNQERLEYLMVRDFLDDMTRLKPRELSKQQVLRMVSLARAYRASRS